MPTIADLSDRYANFMITPGPAGEDRCDICWTPCNPDYGRCLMCGRQPNHLDVVVPVTYSIDRGQMHVALRGYKDGWAGDNSDRLKNTFTGQLAAVLTRFLETHEPCVARAAGVERFDAVTIVPSSTLARTQQHWRLRWIVETGCPPVASRFEMLLGPTPIAAQGKAYDRGRYQATRRLDGKAILLIDDTWTQGRSAQSAAIALRDAGATNVAIVVIGRHVDREWEPVHGSGRTNAEVLANPPRWQWEVCALQH